MCALNIFRYNIGQWYPVEMQANICENSFATWVGLGKFESYERRCPNVGVEPRIWDATPQQKQMTFALASYDRLLQSSLMC